MSITKKNFGALPDGTKVDIFTLTNSKKMSVNIISFGGIIQSIQVPDKNGNIADVALGYNKLDNYIDNFGFIGALIGRYANRIAKGKFELNGKVYQLAKNDGNNHLHGGIVGFHNVVWNSEIVNDNGQEKLRLTHTSQDGEENYPGTLKVKVEYYVTEDNELKLDYSAVSDKDTILNMTNHAYFNLSGHTSGTALKHQVFLNADYYTPTDAESIPTGEILSVKNTVMDFTKLKSFAEGLNSTDQQIVYGKGYDHNWVLNSNGDIKQVAAELYDPESGRLMQVFTTKPGVQFYTGNYLHDKLIGKDNAVYAQRSGVCLETQYFPDSINVKHFKSPVLKAGEQYHHITVYKFSTK